MQKKTHLNLRMHVKTRKHPPNDRFYTFSQWKTTCPGRVLAACNPQEPAHITLLHIFPTKTSTFFSGSCWCQFLKNYQNLFFFDCHLQEPVRKVNVFVGNMCKKRHVGGFL